MFHNRTGGCLLRLFPCRFHSKAVAVLMPFTPLYIDCLPEPLIDYIVRSHNICNSQTYAAFVYSYSSDDISGFATAKESQFYMSIKYGNFGTQR